MSSTKHVDGKFVIQKHDATQLHYDFRLEHDGVLKSWVVPKGPSMDPRVRRLAIEVNDHPKWWAEYEGNIRKENYGGGTVIIWDRGTYRNISQHNDEESMEVDQALKKGHIAFELNGEKLKGGFALTRFNEEEEDGKWLLVKMNDDHADARRNPVSSQKKSVKSGRTLKEVEYEEPTDDIEE